MQPNGAARVAWRISLAAALTLCAPATSRQEARPEPGDWSIDRSDREVATGSGATVAIENLYGDVRVRVGEPERTFIHAVAQRRAADPREARTSVEHDGATVRISVRFDDDAAAEPEAGWELRRVDLSIAVPAGAPLRVTTRGGLIEVKGKVGELHAESESGEVRLWIERGATVRSDRGRIEANLLGETWSEPARFESVTGNVDVLFPARADAEVLLETSGALTTDYSLEVERIGELRKRATARLGSGGARVVLRSERGDLSIRRRIAAPVPSAPQPPSLPSELPLR